MSSVDLAAKPWQALEPHSGNHCPTMLKPDERRYLRWLTQERYTGAGAIVDAGPLLGGSTVSLAEGLRRNTRVPESRKVGSIHSYDLFEYESYMSGLFAGESLPAQGGSLLPRFIAHTEAWRPFIEVYPGDFEQFSWNGGPIEILFIDLAKSWPLQAHLLREFFPYLIPGVSVVVQQDYFFFGCPWIHVVMEHLAGYLTPAHLPDAPSLGFTFDKAIPAHLLEFDYERELSAQDKRRLMERAKDRFTGPKRLVAMTAQAFLQLSENDVDGAVDLLEAVRRSPDVDHTVVHDFDQVTQLVIERLPHESSERFVRDLLVQTDPEMIVAIGGNENADLFGGGLSGERPTSTPTPDIQVYASPSEARRLVVDRRIAFVLIDGLPEHPWPVADLLALLPVLSPGAWVALRDVSVLWNGETPRRGYGSHHLFDTWPGEKRCSGPLGHIGAIRLPMDLSTVPALVAGALQRPWETLLPNDVCLAAQIRPRVRTATSHAVESIREAALSGRPIYVWGAGQGGRNAVDLLRRHDVPVTGFVDRDMAKHGTIVNALPVHPPDRLELRMQPRPYLAISGKFASEIAAGLRAGGWQPQVDYVVW